MNGAAPKTAGSILGSLGLHAAALGLAAVTGMSGARAADLLDAGPAGGGDGSLEVLLAPELPQGDATLVEDVPGVLRPELLEPSFPVLREEVVEASEPTSWLADSASASAEVVVEEPPEASEGVELERSPTLALAGMRAGTRQSKARGDVAASGATPLPGLPRGGAGWSSAAPRVGAMGAGGGGGVGPESGPGMGAGGRAEITGPALLEGSPPSYPKQSVRAEEEGSVLCRIHVSADGLVTTVDVMESSGHERLDRAATEAIRRWRFEPKRVDGRSIATSVVHRVTFRLDRV